MDLFCGHRSVADAVFIGGYYLVAAILGGNDS